MDIDRLEEINRSEIRRKRYKRFRNKHSERIKKLKNKIKVELNEIETKLDLLRKLRDLTINENSLKNSMIANLNLRSLLLYSELHTLSWDPIEENRKRVEKLRSQGKLYHQRKKKIHE